MARTRSTTRPAILLAVVLGAAAAPAVASNGCLEVRQLTAQGATVEEIANAFNAPLGAVQACLQPQAAVAPASRVVSAPAGNAPLNAAGPAPFGAAGPAPLGAAGPAPFGAAGPAPFGAAGPAPVRAAGGTVSADSNSATKR